MTSDTQNDLLLIGKTETTMELAEQLKHLGAAESIILIDQQDSQAVTDIRRDASGNYQLKTRDGNRLQARRLLVCAGVDTLLLAHRMGYATTCFYLPVATGTTAPHLSPVIQKNQAGSGLAWLKSLGSGIDFFASLGCLLGNSETRGLACQSIKHSWQRISNRKEEETEETQTRVETQLRLFNRETKAFESTPKIISTGGPLVFVVTANSFEKPDAEALAQLLATT